MKSILLSSSSNVGRCIIWCWKLRERNIAFYERYQVWTVTRDVVVQRATQVVQKYSLRHKEKKDSSFFPLTDIYVELYPIIQTVGGGLGTNNDREDL
jgi:hypothetical protein